MPRFAGLTCRQRLRRTNGRRGAATLGALAMPAGALLASDFISRAWNDALQWIDHLDRNAWLLVLCGVLAIGAFCLRGFGSRSNY
jgi:hypothetical protein